MTERANLRFHDLLLRPDPCAYRRPPFEPGYPRGFDGGVTRTRKRRLHHGLDDAELTRQLEGVTAHSMPSSRRRRAAAAPPLDEIASRFDGAARCTDAQRRLIGPISRRNIL